jgi:hypothetical protein
MRQGKRNSRQRLVKTGWALERLEDRTLLSGNVSATVTAAGNLLVIGDTKANQIAIQETAGGALQVSSLDGTTTINGGSGPFTAAGFTHDVDVFMNRGDDVVQVGGSGPLTSLPHNLIIDTGAGSDTVDVENTSVGGNLLLFGGTGTDTFSVGSPSTENLVSVTGSVFIVGGSGGSNTIAVFDADITGNLRIFSSGANDQIQVGFDAGLGIIGVDETATGHVEVGGNLQIDTVGGGGLFSGGGGLFSFGGSDFSSDFDKFSMDTTWLKGLESSCSSLLGSRSFSSSDAGQCLSNDLAFLKGWCDDGGFGSFCGTHGSASGIEHVSLADVNVTGKVKIQTGNGADQILLGAAPLPSGDTTSPLNLVFGHVSIGGNLKVSSGNGNDTVLLDGISVTGNTHVKTGNGNDQIAVLGNDGAYTGTFSIDSGTGADKIVVADGANFASSVSIKMSRGSDVLYLASDLFQASVGINGGQGTDTLLQSQSIFPNSFTAGNPTLTSIEVNMPNVNPNDPIVTTNFGWLTTLLGLPPI